MVGLLIVEEYGEFWISFDGNVVWLDEEYIYLNHWKVKGKREVIHTWFWAFSFRPEEREKDSWRHHITPRISWYPS